jgi:branched-chain amino acid transport system substrate-binding protein
MKARVVAVLALVAAVAAAIAASTAGAGSTAATASQAVSCSGPLKIGIITPLTGGAGFLGQEQLSWTRYAVQRLARGLGLRVTVVRGDTPVEKGPGEGLVVAQKMIADSRLVAVIGPATSGAAAAASQALFAAGIAHVNPSATRTSLTYGSNKEATPAFFRVVPGDNIQGPTDANFLADKLNARKVVLIDFQEPYSVGLVDSVQAQLRRKNVETIRLSTSVNTTDFSSLVTRVPNDADFVFFATQQPPDAQTFGQQLLEQGKRAKVFAGDGANNPSAFKLAGSYVSNFAPDISAIPSSKAILDGWKRANPSATLGSFGPPAYLATQVALLAIKRACLAGKGTLNARKDIIRQVKKVRVPNSILGGSFRFSTKTNDPLNAKFYIFQIQPNGTYKLVS